MNAEPYKDRISINPQKRFGRPCVKGTRIAVEDVLSWLASGMSHTAILKDFPELRKEDILACLAYAARRERLHRSLP
ncbi:MAG: DUF433 domain-containing protein [Flavobacteriales bacterium]